MLAQRCAAHSIAAPRPNHCELARGGERQRGSERNHHDENASCFQNKYALHTNISFALVFSSVIKSRDNTEWKCSCSFFPSSSSSLHIFSLSLCLSLCSFGALVTHFTWQRVWLHWQTFSVSFIHVHLVRCECEFVFSTHVRRDCTQHTVFVPRQQQQRQRCKHTIW